MLVVVLLLGIAMADDDFYHFRHGCIMKRRMNKVEGESKKLEKKLRELRKIERRILHELDINYEDTEMATTRKDKILLQQTIRKLQFQLRKTRNAKRILLRRMRKVVDNINGIERGRIIRRNQLEQYVDYHGGDISKEYEHVSKRMYDMEKKYAIENAKVGAKQAAELAYAKIQNKGKITDKNEIKKVVKKAAAKAYKKIYTAIVKIIRALTLRGGNLGRIEHLIKAEVAAFMTNRKTEYTRALTLFNVENEVTSIKTAKKVVKESVKEALKAEVKKDVKKQSKKIVKKETKKVVKTVTKKVVHHDAKRIVKKQAKKQVKSQAKSRVSKLAKKVVGKFAKKTVKKEAKKDVKGLAKNLVKKYAKKEVKKDAKKDVKSLAKNFVKKFAKKEVSKDVKKDLKKVSKKIVKKASGKNKK